MPNLTSESNVSNLPSAPTLSPDVVIPSSETYPDEDEDADADEDNSRDPEPLWECSIRPVIYKYKHAPLLPTHQMVARTLLSTLRQGIMNSSAKMNVLRQLFASSEVRKALFTQLKAPTEKIRLSDCEDLIDFEIHMCGPNYGLAVPSIIASCPRNILVLLRTEMEADHMKSQYAEGFTYGEAFTIYYCATRSASHDMVGREANANVSFHRNESYLSICGSRIILKQQDHSQQDHSQQDHSQQDHTQPSGVATVACIIQIDNDFYALGPAHPFYREDKPRSQELLKFLYDEDAEYEVTFESEDEESDSKEDSLNIGKDVMESSRGSMAPLSKASSSQPVDSISDLEDLAVVFPGPGDLPEDPRDLDWSVIRLANPMNWLLNSFPPDLGYFIPSYRNDIRVSSRSFMKEYYIGQRVYILTSHGSVEGRILSGFANIPAPSGRGSCTVSIISMKDPSCIVKGDSGSLVIDAELPKAYGYVVASNRQGDAYFVEIVDTLDQIKVFFSANKVKLASIMDIWKRLYEYRQNPSGRSKADEEMIRMHEREIREEIMTRTISE
ncbi:hypothetical protein PTNB85_00927 [Pyrenophora teres f. teres]|nr:hypothetical protein PTNB85_00927 [Pyrenophora teres f. teres]